MYPERMYTITTEALTGDTLGGIFNSNSYIYFSYNHDERPSFIIDERSSIEKRKAQVLEWTREKESEHNAEMINARPTKILRAQMRRKPLRSKASKNRVCRRETRYRVMEK